MHSCKAMMNITGTERIREYGWAVRAKHRALVCSVDVVECVALLCCALCCMAVLCDLLVCHAFREALLCAGLPCCAMRCGGRGIHGKHTQEKRFMWACSVAAIVLCCSCAVLRCALCACSWALGVHCCVLLCYRYAENRFS